MWKFLELQPEMFGIDISDSSVKILKLAKKRNGSCVIETFGEAQINAGIVEGGEIKNEEALVLAIKEAINNSKGKKLGTKYVIASLPEEKSFLEVIQMPKMSQEELSSAITFQAENYIPLSIDQVYIDFQVIQADDASLDHLDVLIVAMPKTTVDSYCSCLKKAGLIPFALDIESNAIAMSLVKGCKSQSPLILVNFGKKNSNFAIYYGNSLRFTSSVSVSSDQITQAIAKNMKISDQEAEKIKTNFSILKKDESQQYKDVYNAILPVLNDLVVQVKKYLAFYKDHVSHEHIHQIDGGSEKIILTGGGSNLKGLPEFISSQTSIKTELGNIFSNISVNNSKRKYVDQSQITSSFCTVMGLAIKACDKNNFK